MRALLAAMLSVSIVTGANALNFEIREVVGLRWVQASGEIARGDAAAFLQLTRGRDDLAWLLLDSPGGSMFGSMEVGEAVRQRGFATYVAKDGVCLSACFFAFIGGTGRQVKGKLGVHQFHGGTPGTPEEAEAQGQALTGELVDYVLRMGVSLDALQIALRTPARDMHIFTPEEIERFGLDVAAPGCCEKPD